MTDENTLVCPTCPPVRAIALVLVAILVVAGLYYVAVSLPAGHMAQQPVTNGSRIAGNASCSDSAPDNVTCCYNQLNLQEENRDALVPPTVVDLNEVNGNLLVRGPMPLTLRNGAGRPPVTYGCRDLSDWSFAYANLSGMISAEKTFSPAYFPAARKAALGNSLREFNLSDYHLIDITLVNSQVPDNNVLGIEEQGFGNTYSRCTAPLIPSAIDGHPGNLIVSAVGFCDNMPTTNASCQRLLLTDVSDDTGAYCSYARLISQIDALMKEKDPSGKKRLIYYHCVLGRDRTGGVTMGYLMKTYGLSYTDALANATDLGNPAGPEHPPNQGSQTLALAYCRLIGGNCQDGGSNPPASVSSSASLPTTVRTLTASK